MSERFERLHAFAIEFYPLVVGIVVALCTTPLVMKLFAGLPKLAQFFLSFILATVIMLVVVFALLYVRQWREQRSDRLRSANASPAPVSAPSGRDKH